MNCASTVDRTRRGEHSRMGDEAEAQTWGWTRPVLGIMIRSAWLREK